MGSNPSNKVVCMNNKKFVIDNVGSEDEVVADFRSALLLSGLESKDIKFSGKTIRAAYSKENDYSLAGFFAYYPYNISSVSLLF